MEYTTPSSISQSNSRDLTTNVDSADDPFDFGAAPTPLSDLGQAALRYARQGWAVFPTHTITQDGACSCGGKVSDCKPGKHPRIKDWPNRATTDPKVIAGYWRMWPEANIA